MAAKRTRKLLVLALCLHSLLVFSQITFQKTFGGPGNETANWVAEASNGFVIAGQVTSTAGNQDALLVRLDASGNAIWQKRFGAAQADAFHCVIATPDGGFLAAGETRSFGAGNSDIFLVKVSDGGVVQWSKTIGDADHNDIARSLIPVAGGGYLVSGHSVFYFDNTPNSVFLRLDANGNTIWSRTYSTSVGNLLLSNYIDGNIIYASGGADDEAAFVRLDLNTGNVLSTKAYSGSGTEALYYQQPTQDGNLVIADHTWSASTGSDVEVWVQKINRTNGAVIWSKVYYRTNDNIRGRIEKVNDGGFLLVPYDNDNGAHGDALLAKIDGYGNLLWSYNYGGGAADRLLKAVQTADGGFIAVGDTRSNTANGNSDILLVKIDAKGHIEGACAKEANIQSANFTAENLPIETSQTSWLQSAALTTAPLPLNLLSQTFSPNAAPTVGRTIPLCPNKAYNIGGVEYFAPKLVVDTVESLNGCDTIVQYNLTLNPFNTAINVIGLCANQTYTHNGIQYYAPATILDTVLSSTGACDTVYSIVLKSWAQPTAAQTITFCTGESVMIGGQVYTHSGTVQASVPSTTGGCDTLITYTLVERPLPTRATTISFCPGESVLIGGYTYTQAGTVLSTVPSTNNGCDTMVTYTLELRPQPTRAETRGFCPGQSVTIAGQTYNQPGTVIANLASTNGGCDTIVTYTLELRPQPTRAETRGFCPGQSVTIAGQTYNQAGTVIANIASTNGGCDTIVTYTLELRLQPARAETRSFCLGQSVTIAGQTYNQAGTVIANIASTNGGCDTIVTYTLELRPQPVRAETRSFCPGQSITIAGQTYNQAGTVIANIASTNGGCDTIVTYTLELRPQPVRAETRSFCPGQSITIAGQTYNQAGTVIANIASTNGGCDTIVTYTLELRPQPARAETRSFCPGQSVTIAGQNYNQAGTVIANIASTNGGCDTVVTYTLELRPQPTRAETRGFCPNESVTIAGQTYNQPGTVIANIASTNGGCDTVVTYTLQYLTPSPSNISIHCPNDVTLVGIAGISAMPVTYSDPLAASDCICPGLEISRTGGLASGSQFPIGSSIVNYIASDKCGQTSVCSFKVTVRQDNACDVKVNGCMKYELLNITSDDSKNYTYRIRVTNNCSNKLIYTAIQIPDGVVAMEPGNFATYVSPAGRYYVVRSPNYSPMYSVRFKTTTDSIVNGESDIFEYTLPAQTNVKFINITSRVANQATLYEAHLNVFNCPVGLSSANQRPVDSRDAEKAENLNSLLLFPNPTTGVLFADLSDWQGQKLQIQITNTQGQKVHSMQLTAEEDLLRVEMPRTLASGVYFLELTSEKGEKETLRFVLQR